MKVSCLDRIAHIILKVKNNYKRESCIKNVINGRPSVIWSYQRQTILWFISMPFSLSFGLKNHLHHFWMLSSHLKLSFPHFEQFYLHFDWLYLHFKMFFLHLKFFFPHFKVFFHFNSSLLHFKVFSIYPKIICLITIWCRSLVNFRLIVKGLWTFF